MRKWLLNLHLYGGLLCSSYLVLYGLTSLQFNHGWLLPAKTVSTVEWSAPVERPTTFNKRAVADHVKEQLALPGWVHPWSIQRDQQQNYTVEISRPGKRYVIHYDPRAGTASVKEERKNIAAILQPLHGLYENVPGMPWMRPWGWYTEITNWVVLFSVITGIILFAYRSRERRTNTIILGACSVLSLGFILYIWLVG